MATQNLGESLLIVPYEWKLENVEKDFKTIASNLILFHGEKVFRVALKKNGNGPPDLVFLAINLNKMGLYVKDAVCGMEGDETHCKMLESQAKRNVGEGGLQLFTSKVEGVIGETCTFLFQIHLKGIVTGYQYNPCDRLAKEQLWATVNSKLNADVEFIVQDKRFSAHKALLAARSPVFRVEFTKEESKKTNPQQIRIDDVDGSSFEQFLHFLYTGEFLQFSYTGEPAPTMANKDLLKLAEHYQLEILENLCQGALLDVNYEQMARFVVNSHGQETNLKIR